MITTVTDVMGRSLRTLVGGLLLLALTVPQLHAQPLRELADFAGVCAAIAVCYWFFG